MRILNWALESQKTILGKIISVMLAGALVLSLSSIFYDGDALAFESEEGLVEQDEKLATEDDNNVAYADRTSDQQPGNSQQETTKSNSNKSGMTNSDQADENAAQDEINTGQLEEEKNSDTENSGNDNESAESGASLPGITFDENMTLAIEGSNPSFDWDEFKNEIDNNAAFNEWKNATSLVVNDAELVAGAFASFGKLSEVTLNNVCIADNTRPFMNVANDSASLTIRMTKGKIGKYAFHKCDKLQNLVLDSVEFADEACALQNAGADGLSLSISNTTIGIKAFATSKNLQNATIKDCSVGNRAFFACSNLKSAVFEGSNTVGDYSFQRCGFSSLYLTNISSTGNGAFSFNNNLEKAKIDGIDVIGKHLFYKSEKLERVEIEGCKEIAQFAFRDCPALKEVQVNNVSKIEAWAFRACSALEKVTLSKVGSIDGGAFEGCDNLTEIDIDKNTKLGYLDADRNLVNVIAGITDRVKDILKGKFILDSAEDIIELDAEEGWADSKVGKSENWNAYDNGTQIVEQARWTNDEATEAEVKVDAYFTAEKQMDYIFVIDMSNSMTLLGNPSDMNARFYDMQSKLYDVSSQLLNSKGYDCRVAFVTFGSTSSKTLGFFSEAEQAYAAIDGLTPYWENTNYGIGLAGAKSLIKTHEPGRKTSVVFISDGQPRGDGEDVDGKIGAEAIGELGVSIYGVLQSVPEDESEGATAAMKEICTDGLFFKATDTSSFSESVNKAIAAKYPTQTITIPVNPAFENVKDINVSVSGGTATLSEDGRSIVWTITGMPFTKHTLTYSMNLTSENTDRDGTFFVNEGNATIASGAYVESPQLSRTVVDPTNPVPTDPADPVEPTPNPTPDPDIADDPVPTPIQAPAPAPTPAVAAPPAAVPAAAAPADTPDAAIPDDETPLAQPADQQIADNETPMTAFDEPHCWVHYLMFIGIILTAIYGAAVVLRRLGYIRKMNKFEKDVTGTGTPSYDSGHQAQATYHVKNILEG